MGAKVRMRPVLVWSHACVPVVGDGVKLSNEGVAALTKRSSPEASDAAGGRAGRALPSRTRWRGWQREAIVVTCGLVLSAAGLPREGEAPSFTSPPCDGFAFVEDPLATALLLMPLTSARGSMRGPVSPTCPGPPVIGPRAPPRPSDRVGG